VTFVTKIVTALQVFAAALRNLLRGIHLDELEATKGIIMQSTL